MKNSCSVWSNYFFELSPEQRIDAFLECGFTCSEFSDEDGAILLQRGSGEAEGAKLKRYADERGFAFPQGHLLLSADICNPDSVDVLKNWLDLFLSLGIRSAVLHAAGGADLTAEQRFERRVAVLRALAAYLRGTDLTICLENLMHETCPRTSADLMRYIDAAGGDHLGICLDTGHLNVCRCQYGVAETQREFIQNSGARLKALHIADNDGSSDQHLMPYGRGCVDWSEVTAALGETGYSGLFNLEIPGECCAPLELKKIKLRYIGRMCAYMLASR